MAWGACLPPHSCTRTVTQQWVKLGQAKVEGLRTTTSKAARAHVTLVCVMAGNHRSLTDRQFCSVLTPLRTQPVSHAPCLACEITRACFTTMQHTHHELDTLVEDTGCVRDVGLLLLAHLAPSCHILLNEVSLLLARSWVLGSVPGASTAEVWTCCGCGKVSRRQDGNRGKRIHRKQKSWQPDNRGSQSTMSQVTHQPTSSQPWLLHHPQCTSYAAALQLACTPVHALQPKRKGCVRRSTMHDHNEFGLLHE